MVVGYRKALNLFHKGLRRHWLCKEQKVKTFLPSTLQTVDVPHMAGHEKDLAVRVPCLDLNCEIDATEEKAAPCVLRQVWQWQWTMRVSSASASYLIAPHTQLPVSIGPSVPTPNMWIARPVENRHDLNSVFQ